MTADAVVERAAKRLEARAARLAERNGWRRRLASQLEEDADFLRRLKPSLVRARLEARGPDEPKPPSGGGAKQALLVVGAALAAGVVLAKLLDWRGHAHPSL